MISWQPAPAEPLFWWPIGRSKVLQEVLRLYHSMEWLNGFQFEQLRVSVMLLHINVALGF